MNDVVDNLQAKEKRELRTNMTMNKKDGFIQMLFHDAGQSMELMLVLNEKTEFFFF